jgi:hypothetical protein
MVLPALMFSVIGGVDDEELNTTWICMRRKGDEFRNEPDAQIACNPFA